MTTLFNPDIGDLGSAAAPVAPVVDRTKIMQEQIDVQQAADTAADFNSLAQGMFAIAPVAKEIAAQKYVEKHVTGTNGAADLEQATDYDKATKDARDAISSEVDLEKRVVAEDIKTLRGLEEARRQGAITFDEMQLRAQQIRASAINRAPLFADYVNSEFRAITGTSTGTGGIAANPWSMTPEETAVHEDRKTTALYAQEYNVDLQTADRMRAEDAWVERNKTMKPETDAQFQLWADGEVLAARVSMDRAILKLADANGTFTPEAQNAIRLKIREWEASSLQNIQAQAASMLDKGITPSRNTITSIASSVQKQAADMLTLLENNDSVAYIQGMNNVASAKASLWVHQFMPALSIAKAAGVDIVELSEAAITNPQFFEYLKVNPAMNLQAGLLGLDQNDVVLAHYFDAMNYASGNEADSPTATSDVDKQSAVMDVLNAGPQMAQGAWDIARESGNLDVGVYTPLTTYPEGIVHLKDATLWPSSPSTEELTSAFTAAATGVEGKVFANKPLGESAEYSIWVNDDGSVGMEGNGVDNFVIGAAQDLYDTLVANEDVWKSSDYDSPDMYLQSLFPGRKFTLTGKTSPAITELSRVPGNQLTETIGTDVSRYTTSIEDVEAASEVLNNRLMTLPPSVDNISERNKIINLQNSLWEQWESVANAPSE